MVDLLGAYNEACASAGILNGTTPPFNLAVTGHRPKDLWPTGDPRWTALRSILIQSVRPLIRAGIWVRMISGMALGVDQEFWRAGWVLRRAHPQGVSLKAAIPCRDQDALWSADQRARYAKMLEAADHLHYVQDGPYTTGCMQRRNQWMVDHCDAVLAVWNGRPGGTSNFVAAAWKRGVPVVVLDPGSVTTPR